MPKLVACGGRNAAFDDFKVALASARKDDRVFLWIDSEDPVADIEATWQHLKARDGWTRPRGATDEQVLFMTTCMETWIVADRATLAEHYGADLQESALPPCTTWKDGLAMPSRTLWPTPPATVAMPTPRASGRSRCLPGSSRRR
jgi:hypothetical protein